MGLEWISCVSLSCLHFACVLALFLFFRFFRRSSFFFVFFAFLCFSLFLFVSEDFSVFCTFPGSCCRLSLSLRLRGNCKNPKKRKFRSDPAYTNPVRNFPSDAPFSRLRPNDPSSRLTNDTREDPITESHRPIANKNSPKIFKSVQTRCIVKARLRKVHFSGDFLGVFDFLRIACSLGIPQENL